MAKKVNKNFDTKLFAERLFLTACAWALCWPGFSPGHDHSARLEIGKILGKHHEALIFGSFDQAKERSESGQILKYGDNRNIFKKVNS